MKQKRKTAEEGFRMFALFAGGEAFSVGALAEAMGWSRSKAYGMLSSASAAGYLEAVEELEEQGGKGDRYRMSAGFREALARGMDSGTRRDLVAVARRRCEETVRAVRAQMDSMIQEIG